jgi:8-oxo-dGTP diphosphatase
MDDFIGAKAAFFHRDTVLVCLRDAFAHIPWPDHWDLPGGGREGEESPEECLLRELQEEFGLALPQARLIYRRIAPAMLDPARRAFFFAGWITKEEIAAIRFGSEGQCWQMMPVAEFLIHPRGIPEKQLRTRLAWEALR